MNLGRQAQDSERLLLSVLSAHVSLLRTKNRLSFRTSGGLSINASIDLIIPVSA